MKYWHINCITGSSFDWYWAWAWKPCALAFTRSHLYMERSKLYLDLLWNHVAISRGTIVSINTPSDCQNGMFAVSTNRWVYHHCNHVREAYANLYTGVCWGGVLLSFFFLIAAVKITQSMINGLVICLELSVSDGNKKPDLNLTCKVKGRDSLLQWRKAEDMSLKFEKKRICLLLFMLWLMIRWWPRKEKINSEGLLENKVHSMVSLWSNLLSWKSSKPVS